MCHKDERLLAPVKWDAHGAREPQPMCNTRYSVICLLCDMNDAILMQLLFAVIFSRSACQPTFSVPEKKNGQKCIEIQINTAIQKTKLNVRN